MMKELSELIKRKNVCRNLIVAFVLLLSVSVVYAADVPNTDFVSGTTISSQEMDDNFDYIGLRLWELSGTDLYYTAGKVAIGTSSLAGSGSDVSLRVQGKIHVRDDDISTKGYMVLDSGDAGQVGYIEWREPGDTAIGYMGYGDGSHLGLNLQDSTPFAIIGGDVGIGTTSPDEKFEVEFGANTDVEIGVGATATNQTFIKLRSPDGTEYWVTVADGGTLSILPSKP